MIELMIDDRRGDVWDISDVVTDVSWQTSRIGKPGSLDFKIIKGGLFESRSFSYDPGDIVRFRFDGKNIFYGYIFTIDSGRDDVVNITAYDQIRYLMTSDTYVLAGVTAADVIKRIAGDFGLKVGSLDTPSYKIPTMIEDTQKLLDIIDKALTLTLHHGNQNFVFFDDFGKLSLRLVDDMLVDVYLGDGSLMYDYSYKRSIDSDTYNQIKLVQDNKKTQKRDVHMARDSANIAKWGLLQYYEKVDEGLNEAQIKKLLDTLATLKNRETRSISIEAIGDPLIRAGSYVRIRIDEEGINQAFLIDNCKHRFGDDHTMSLELKVI